MSDIPIPMIHGATDSEKIREIESYLSRLSEVLIRELSSIGFQNLSQDLSQKISGAIESHQDLSEYATKSYVKDNFIDNEEIASYATTTWVNNNFIDNNEISSYAKSADVEQKILNLNISIAEIRETIKKLQDDVDVIEGRLGIIN